MRLKLRTACAVEAGTRAFVDVEQFLATRDGFQAVKLQSPTRATVCSHSKKGRGRQLFYASHQGTQGPAQRESGKIRIAQAPATLVELLKVLGPSRHFSCSYRNWEGPPLRLRVAERGVKRGEEQETMTAADVLN